MMKLTKKNAWLARTGLLISVGLAISKLIDAETAQAAIGDAAAVAIIIWTAFVIYIELEKLEK
jgi:hypothetical protein